MAPGYPYYQYEGSYPENTPCSGQYYLPDVSGGAKLTADFAGRTITLLYYYSDNCGSFARIENAPSGQWAFLDRSDDGGATWDPVYEPVEEGIDYAYTKVGNNLRGRLSRAALVAEDGRVLARTEWY